MEPYLVYIKKTKLAVGYIVIAGTVLSVLLCAAHSIQPCYGAQAQEKKIIYQSTPSYYYPQHPPPFF